MMPFTFVWGVLSIAVAWAFDGSMAGGFFAFAVLSAATFVYLDRQEREFSRAGLERHRVDQAAALKHKEMDQQHELRRAALRAHLNMLEGKQDD